MEYKESFNSLGGTINQDVSKSLLKPEFLYNSINFRVSNDENASFGSRVNIKGNTAVLSIPNTYDVLRLAIVPSGTTRTTTIAITSENNGVVYTETTGTFTIDVNSISKNLYDFITSDINITRNGIDYRLWYDDNYVYVQGLTSTVSVVTRSGIVNNSIYLPAQTNLDVIGWVNLRDDIYLFTTNETARVSSLGQIWKMTYDKSKPFDDPNTYSIDLIYNNYLDFTILQPIANPGGIVARYETSDIQRIYWTDYYNVPRALNVADPNAHQLLPESLNLFPILDQTPPLLQEILITGVPAMRLGMHSYSYRLSKSTGAQTRFSLPSQEIIVGAPAENVGIIPYIMQDITNNTTGKANKILIENIDGDYDTIQIVDIYRRNKDELPEITVVYNGTFPQNGRFEFTHYGNEADTFTIDISEYNIAAPIITKAKSIASKLNTLFFANVELSSFDLDFDARAYRFPHSSTTTTVEDSQGNSLTLNGTAWTINGSTIPENHDVIQNYDSQAPTNWNNNLYQRNSLVFGGSGPNVSYRFTRDSTHSNLTLDSDNKDINSLPFTGAPHRDVNLATKDIDLGTGVIFRNKNSMADMHSPYLLDVLLSYQSDEMYRFGLVLFDHYGNPSYVKYIADIRMPSKFMPTGTNKYNRDLQFPLYHQDGSGAGKTEPLGIEFTVDLSSVANQISGFSIVRVERTVNDKHILGQGIFTPVIEEGGINFINGNLNDAGLPSKLWNPRFADNTFQSEYASFKCPEFLFGASPSFVDGDTLDIVGLANDSQSNWLQELFTGGAADGTSGKLAIAMCVKNYDFATTTAPITDSATDNPYKIKDILPVPAYSTQAQPAFTFNGDSFHNRSKDSEKFSMGANTLLLYYGTNSGNSGNFDVAGDDYLTADDWVSDTTPNNKVYIANYKRNVTNQYGGNSYSQRSNNEYIYCNHFVQTTSSTTTSTSIVFGGDVMCVPYDYAFEFGNYFDGTIGTDELRHRTFIVPIETTFNIEIRRGTRAPIFTEYEVANKDQLYLNTRTVGGNARVAGIDIREYNEAAPVYTPQHNNIFFVPKPLNFRSTKVYDNRVYKSNTKIDGELIDSWSSVATDAFKNVDAEFGGINNMVLFKDQLFFFQDKAFGVLQVGQQKLLQATDDSSALVLGNSGILERYDYISSIVGSKHQFSFSYNDNSILWYDAYGRKLYRYRPGALEPLSDVKGLNSFLYNNIFGTLQVNDNPYDGKGITSTYDYRHNEYLITFLDEQTAKGQTQATPKYFTVVYNELLDGFTGYYTYYPKVYINDKLNIFCIDGTSIDKRLFINNYGAYGSFFGKAIQPSSLSFIVNPYPNYEKVLTNLEFITEGLDDNDTPFSINTNTFFTKMRFFDTYQNTDWINTSQIAKQRKTIWNVKVPGNRVLYTNRDIFDPGNISPTHLPLVQRLKDKWFMVDAEFNNLNNGRLVVHSAKSIYNLNNR